MKELSQMENKILQTIKIRAATEADVGFVFNSWLKSHRYSDSVKGISSPIYYSGQHRLIERAIETGKLLIACSKEDESHIYGYVCAGHYDGHLAVHYIYVKQTYRNLGIGLELLNQFRHGDTAAFYTHSSKMSELLNKKYSMIYHPYLLMELYNENKSAIQLAINSESIKSGGGVISPESEDAKLVRSGS